MLESKTKLHLLLEQRELALSNSVAKGRLMEQEIEALQSQVTAAKYLQPATEPLE